MLLLEVVLELLVEIFGEVALELIWGAGEHATGGRMVRVLRFAGGGAVVGFLSHLVRPRLVIADPLARYAVVAGLVLAGGLLLAGMESRLRARGQGATAAGFLSGIAFGVSYVAVRRFLI